jgi:hypothetical protein
MRQGPHHSAQKSTTTGSADFSTSDSKLASDVLPTTMEYLVFFGFGATRLKEGNRTYERDR